MNSGRGPTNKEIHEIAAAVREIKNHVGIDICCSLGLMDQEKARTLKEAGVGRVNHNLNTSQQHHPAVVTTHSYEDRVATIEEVKAAGLSTCSGGIIGMGETDDDIIDLALTIRELDIDSIPVNFLNSENPLRDIKTIDTPALPKNALSLSLRKSRQRDSCRRWAGSEFAFAAAVESFPGEFDFRQRLSNNTRPTSLRRPSHDRRSRLRD